MDVAAADAPLLVGDHAEVVGDPAVARGRCHGEFVRHGRRQPDGQQLGPAGGGGLAGNPAQPGQFGVQSAAGVHHIRGGFDLAAGQLQLKVHPVLGGVGGDLFVTGDRFAALQIDEQELLLDTHRRMTHHG